MILSIIRLARPTQWLKNGILLAPLVFAGEMTDQSKVVTALFATVLFCMLSSAIYVFNDIMDCDKDKLHPLKKERPIASGEISKGTASILMLLLVIAGLGIPLLLNADQEDSMAMDKTIPPIDANRPAVVEIATFAMG